jgi:hypothetical protein
VPSRRLSDREDRRHDHEKNLHDHADVAQTGRLDDPRREVIDRGEETDEDAERQESDRESERRSTSDVRRCATTMPAPPATALPT